MFNPISPTHDMMAGTSACYRTEFVGLSCPGEMFGADAPGNTWHMTFDHANLGPRSTSTPVPGSSGLWSQGNGQVVVQQPKQARQRRGGGHGGGGGGGGAGGGGGRPARRTP